MKQCLKKKATKIEVYQTELDKIGLSVYSSIQSTNIWSSRYFHLVFIARHNLDLAIQSLIIKIPMLTIRCGLSISIPV